MTQKELKKSCPFCNSPTANLYLTKKWVEGDEYTEIFCNRCKISFRLEDDVGDTKVNEKKLIEFWNKEKGGKSSMSKGLEGLKDIKEKYKDDNGLQRRLNVIEKELKAFEIIKEKKFDTYHFIKTNYQNYNEYLDRMCFLNGCDRNNVFEKCWGILTQEEFDLLKEVLKDE